MKNLVLSSHFLYSPDKKHRNTHMSTNSKTEALRLTQGLPKSITDALGDTESKTTWIFCGPFPLKEIANGRRACRHTWRNRCYPLHDRGRHVLEEEDDSWPMLAVCKSTEEHPRLCLEREYADELGPGETFGTIVDLLAEDWYLEPED